MSNRPQQKMVLMNQQELIRVQVSPEDILQAFLHGQGSSGGGLITKLSGPFTE
jgi:hypothetical protein